jgi:hypothetical protein
VEDTLCPQDNRRNSGDPSPNLDDISRQNHFCGKERVHGTGPYSTQKDDVVVLFPGIDMPMIVRLNNQERDCWRLVAPAYGHGIMKGELWKRKRK